MDTPYILYDARGPVSPARIRSALRRQRRANPHVYADVFGTDSVDPSRVLVSEHNADNVAALVDAHYTCAC